LGLLQDRVVARQEVERGPDGNELDIAVALGESLAGMAVVDDEHRGRLASTPHPKGDPR